MTEHEQPEPGRAWMLHPRSPYELAMWVVLGLFFASLVGTASAVFWAWGFNAFAALFLLTVGTGIGTFILNQMFQEDRLHRATPVLRPVDPGADLFEQKAPRS